MRSEAIVKSALQFIHTRTLKSEVKSIHTYTHFSHSSENGVSLDESNKKCEAIVKSALSRRKTEQDMENNLNNNSTIVEVELDHCRRATGLQYHRKLFSINLEKYPRSQVGLFFFTVCV